MSESNSEDYPEFDFEDDIACLGHKATLSPSKGVPLCFGYSSPCPVEETIRCRVIRKKPIDGKCESFNLYIERGEGVLTFMLGSVMRNGVFRRSIYFCLERASCTTKTKEVCGTLDISVNESSFTLNTIRGVALVVTYDTDKSQPRGFDVGIPSLMEANKMIKLINKKPILSSDTGAYVLNFNRRVNMSSTKNVQIISGSDRERIVMQTGKRRQDEYILDFTYPLTALQAFGTMLAVFYNQDV
eukprot:GHVP01002912.1.p1 GENE.GHVP01002912.1~~GHVP01002912.1.p1  ORF type:complete len:243 (+),score=30.33 GHVP01002912.1:1011-1739(+)